MTQKLSDLDIKIEFNAEQDKLTIFVGNTEENPEINKVDDLGRRQGRWIEYWDGKPMCSMHFVDGKANGPFESYDRKTGNVLCRVNLKNFEKDGVMDIFDPKTGELVEQRVYKEGVQLETISLKPKTPAP